jgi:16S rRNA (guanine1207-N2)-methyltransferase
MTITLTACNYGAPSAELIDWPPHAVQVSPLIPGSADLATFAPASMSAVVIAAPPGTIERRYVLALALRALKPGGRFAALAPADKGGARLGKELIALGLGFEETGRRHQRLCVGAKGDGPEDPAIAAAIDAGSLMWPAELGLWTQPGVFSWDRIDPGTALLLSHLPALSGRGIGVIARGVLASAPVTELHLVDLDRRAVAAARRNVEDPRAHFHWADARTEPTLEGLNFVVCNPPFHDGGAEDRALGQTFIRRARAMLKTGGVLWLVANRHLPYEGVLGEVFARVTRKADAAGYKVYEARR